jgi:hypothetical protein
MQDTATRTSAQARRHVRGVVSDYDPATKSGYLTTATHERFPFRESAVRHIAPCMAKGEPVVAAIDANNVAVELQLSFLG